MGSITGVGPGRATGHLSEVAATESPVPSPEKGSPVGRSVGTLSLSVDNTPSLSPLISFWGPELLRVLEGGGKEMICISGERRNLTLIYQTRLLQMGISCSSMIVKGQHFQGGRLAQLVTERC